MGLVEGLAGALLFGLVAYAVLGGADFGGGVWDLLASGPRAGRQRQLIEDAIGPIWEANHVWLIAVVTLLFAAFPPAFARIMTALHIPVAAMLLGIVLRGSSFIFRKYDVRGESAQRRWGRIFAVSSIATPVLLGMVIGAVSTPALSDPATTFYDVFVRPWLRPFPIAVGLFTLVQFVFLAAVYLTVEADDPELREDFRRRALLSAVAVGALAFGVLFLSDAVAPGVVRRLLGRWWSWPLQGATAVAAVGAIVLLWRRRFVAARLFAALQVALVIFGWGLAMNPYLVAGTITIHEAAAPPDTLRALAIGLAAGALVLVPSFGYLIHTFKGGTILGATHDRRPGERGG